VSSTTHTPASTSQGRFGFSCDHSVLRTRMLHKPPPPCISLFSHVLLMSFGCKVDLLKAKPKKERGSESGFHTFPHMLCYQQEQT